MDRQLFEGKKEEGSYPTAIRGKINSIITDLVFIVSWADSNKNDALAAEVEMILAMLKDV